MLFISLTCSCYSRDFSTKVSLLCSYCFEIMFSVVNARFALLIKMFSSFTLSYKESGCWNSLLFRIFIFRNFYNFYRNENSVYFPVRGSFPIGLSGNIFSSTSSLYLCSTVLFFARIIYLLIFFSFIDYIKQSYFKN